MTANTFLSKMSELCPSAHPHSSSFNTAPQGLSQQAGVDLGEDKSYILGYTGKNLKENYAPKSVDANFDQMHFKTSNSNAISVL